METSEISEENYLIFSTYLNNACSINNIPPQYQGPINFEFPTISDRLKAMRTITYLLKERDNHQKTISDAHGHLARMRQELISAQKKTKAANYEAEQSKRELAQYRLRAELAQQKLCDDRDRLAEKTKTLLSQVAELKSCRRMMEHQKRKQESQFKELQEKMLLKAKGPPSLMMPIKPFAPSSRQKKKEQEEIQLLRSHVQSLANQIQEIIEENTHLRESYLNMEVALKKLVLDRREEVEASVNPQKYELPFKMARDEIEAEVTRTLGLVRQRIEKERNRPSVSESEQSKAEKTQLREKVSEYEETIQELENIIERYIDEDGIDMERERQQMSRWVLPIS